MMDRIFKCHGFECEIIETEDGYSINIKGDKEKLKAKVEFIEAYFNYREKAKAAGFDLHPHRHHGHHHRMPSASTFLGHMHEHMKAMHEKHMNKSDKE